MTATSGARILVVDDDVQIRRALRSLLGTRGYEVALAASGEEALEMAALQPPQMVILDLAMPGMNGIEVCRELRTWLNAPILVLSVRDRESDKVAALDTGADDYLTKPFSSAELLARVRAHLRRASETSNDAPVFEAEGLRLDFARRLVWAGDEAVHLTRTEYGLLEYLARNAGRVVTSGMLLTQVWGPEYEGDTQTLRVHIGNLRRKIEPDPNRPRFLLTEPGVGYRFRGEP